MGKGRTRGGTTRGARAAGRTRAGGRWPSARRLRPWRKQGRVTRDLTSASGVVVAVGGVGRVAAGTVAEAVVRASPIGVDGKHVLVVAVRRSVCVAQLAADLYVACMCMCMCMHATYICTCTCACACHVHVHVALPHWWRELRVTGKQVARHAALAQGWERAASVCVRGIVRG